MVSMYLHYEETDGATYSFTQILEIQGDSEEQIICEIDYVLDTYLDNNETVKCGFWELSCYRFVHLGGNQISEESLFRVFDKMVEKSYTLTSKPELDVWDINEGIAT